VLCGTSGVLGNVGKNHVKTRNWKIKITHWSLYTKVDESDTTGFNKMGVNNKEMVTNNRDQKLVLKIQG
jgi:hypothetical protein